MSFFAKNTCNLISKCYNRLNKRKAPLERKVLKMKKRLAEIRTEIEKLEKVSPFYRDYEKVKELKKEEREIEDTLAGINMNYEEWF